MNPRLQKLEPYPFERMNVLKQGIRGNPAYEHVALSIGEPKHQPPQFVVDLLSDQDTLLNDLSTYPATRGTPELREAIANWLKRRFAVTIDPATSVLPVAGTREALFSFGQAVLQGKSNSLAILPNPFYQIYEGAIHLGGATPYFVNSEPGSGYLPDYRSIDDGVWKDCELLYLCSPGNPTGRTLPPDDLLWLIEQAHAHDFVIAADECYSEIYFDLEAPPSGLLEVAASAGYENFDRCVIFHSLSKRSNLPGLRSGFVAGDPAILEPYFQYRTYEGCALPVHVQTASAAAWSDETHVEANRLRYADKFDRITGILGPVFDLVDPQGGFYHWINVGTDDQTFTRDLFVEQNITVLPGSYLSREAHGVNPGTGHVRVAWVAELDECVDAASRLADWVSNRSVS